MTCSRPSPLALAATLLALAATPLRAQIGHPPLALPPTSPTSLPAPNTLPAPIAATPIPANTPQRATVTYAAGLLNVRADNSSLNQILRSISRLTGMTITGGVADERVFGNYGPAEPSTILATLLDGTGSNMLLREGPNNTLAELILTPRSGGVTPPNPNAAGFDDSPEDSNEDARRGDNRQNAPPPPRGFPGQAQRPLSQRSPQQSPSDLQTQQTQTTQQPQAVPSGPVSIPLPANNVNGSETNTSPTASTYPTTNSVPIDSVPTPSTTPPSTGIVDAPNPPPPNSTTGTNSGASTPQSIYEQLKALQQKNQQPQQPSTPQSQPTPQ